MQVCPAEALTGEVAVWVEEFGFYARLEVMPAAGGMSEQDARTLAAFAVLSDERAAIESVQMNERAKGAKDGRRGSK